MSYKTKIHNSKNYDSFHLIEGNREVSLSHVNKLICDVSFPKKFHTCPIVINDQGHIIDGQHRFMAAKELGLPIYFILDPSAQRTDIRDRNKNQMPWTAKDYIFFYSKHIKDYEYILDLKKNHKVPYTLIFAAIKYFGGYKHIKFSYELKDGLVKTWYFKKDLDCFLDSYIPAIKKCVSAKGEKECSPLFLDSYVVAACYFFKNDKNIYQKFISKLIKFPYEFAHANSNERAREFIKKIAEHKVKKTEV